MRPGPRAPRTRRRRGRSWDNSAVMEDILRVRHELAQLLEFANYADYALATRMAKSTGEVFAFLEQLRAGEPSGGRAGVARARAVRRRASSRPGTSATGPSGCSANAIAVSQEELRPYFAAAAGARRPVRSGAAAVRRAHRRAHGRARVASRCALLRDPRMPPARPAAASTSIRARARTSAAAPGWTSAWAARA